MVPPHPGELLQSLVNFKRFVHCANSANTCWKPFGLTRFIRSAFQFKVRSAYLASGSRHWLNKGNTPELALCEFHAYLCLPLLSSSTKKGRHLFLPCKKVERIGAGKSFVWTKGQNYPAHLENFKLKAPFKIVMRRKQIDNRRPQTVARTPLLPRLSLGSWTQGQQQTSAQQGSGCDGPDRAVLGSFISSSAKYRSAKKTMGADFMFCLRDVLRHVCTFCKQTGRKSQAVPRSHLWLHFIDPKHTKTKAPSLQCLDAKWQHAPSAGWVNRKDAISHGGTGGTRPYQRCRTASSASAAWIKECLGPISNIQRMRPIAGSLPGLWPRDLGFVRFSWAMHGHAGLGMAGPILVKFWFQSPLKCFGLASFATTKLADICRL